MSTKIILFRGLPGVGKSFIADETAKILKIAILRRDDIYECIYPDINNQENRNEICYNIIYKIVETNLSAGTEVIIDCPFENHMELQKLSSFISVRNGELKSILCNCSDPNVWEERFNERKANPSANNLFIDFNELKNNYPMELEKYSDELHVDTTKSLDDNILDILNYVG